MKKKSQNKKGAGKQKLSKKELEKISGGTTGAEYAIVVNVINPTPSLPPGFKL